MQACIELSSFVTVTAVALFCSTLVLRAPVEGFDLTPPRYSQHEYERFDVNTMTYQAARAACRHIGSHLDMPVLIPAEIHYRWPGIISEMLEHWYWAPISREVGDTWRWWSGSPVDLSRNDMAAWCRLRAFNKTKDQFALDWDGFGYAQFDSLKDVTIHFLTDETPVLYKVATGGRGTRWCKQTCDDVHADENLPFGCWFCQHYSTGTGACVLLLSPSFPSTLYDVVPQNDTYFFFRSCFYHQLYDNDTCWLECGCKKPSAPSTLAEARAEDKKIKAELTLPAGNLSAAVRRKTSALDPRPSAQGVGWVGVSFATTLLLAICLLDVASLKRDLCMLVSNVRGFFGGAKTKK